MEKELQDKLYNDYPKLFRQKDLGIYRSCMAWGICTGPGWFNILECLCRNIQDCIDNRIKSIEYWDEDEKAGRKHYYPRPELIAQVEFEQVKEKLGGLRVYYTGGNPYTAGMITLAESISGYICEECGKPGKRTNKGWVRTECKECETERKELRKKNEIPST
jgi:hypothetical protein